MGLGEGIRPYSLCSAGDDERDTMSTQGTGMPHSDGTRWTKLLGIGGRRETPLAQLDRMETE